MIIQGQAGSLPGAKQTSGNPNVASGLLTELLVSELTPRYYSLLKNGLVQFLNLSAGAATGFTGGAAGTPLIGLYNPPNSGYDIVVIHTRIGVRTTGGTGGAVDFNWYMGPSVLPTGTITTPRNAYSGAQAGSIALGFVNTAMTSSTAINAVGPVMSLGVSTAAAAQTVFPALDDSAGLIVAAPGNLIAIGAAASLATSSIDCGVIWAELPA